MICDVDWVRVEIYNALRNIEDFLHTVVSGDEPQRHSVTTRRYSLMGVWGVGNGQAGSWVLLGSPSGGVEGHTYMLASDACIELPVSHA